MKIQNYISGKWQDSTGGKWLDVFEPARGKPYSKLPDSGAEDIDKAVLAASAAFESWSTLTAEDRAKFIRKIASLIESRKNHFAEAESRDTGKPLWLAQKVDIPRSIKNLEFFADAITQYASESYQTSPEILNYVLRSPLGVVACISPWNLPLYLLTWKIAPALVSGNTVVAKPSEVTPMTAFLFSEVCQEAGLPPGVLNIVHGTGAGVGERLCTHPKVKAVSFTGSTSTGKIIASMAAPLFKKVSLEMGGKNPTIIFSDCDFKEAVSETVKAGFTNQGEICLCGSRVFVQSEIYDRFKDALIEEVKRLKVGDPSSKVRMGALVSRQHYEKVLSYIELGKKEGGKLLLGGGRPNLPEEFSEGWFVQPTVFEGLSPECRFNQEEIFGPVISLIPFNTEEEVLRYANGVSYGLSASVWTSDLSRGHRMAQKLEAGIVWVNCWMLRDLRVPFGGMKSSGVGREGGLEVLRFFTEPKSVTLRVNQEGGRGNG